MARSRSGSGIGGPCDVGMSVVNDCCSFSKLETNTRVWCTLHTHVCRPRAQPKLTSCHPSARELARERQSEIADARQSLQASRPKVDSILNLHDSEDLLALGSRVGLPCGVPPFRHDERSDRQAASQPRNAPRLSRSFDALLHRPACALRSATADRTILRIVRGPVRILAFLVRM